MLSIYAVPGADQGLQGKKGTIRKFLLQHKELMFKIKETVDLAKGVGYFWFLSLWSSNSSNA